MDFPKDVLVVTQTILKYFKCTDFRKRGFFKEWLRSSANEIYFTKTDACFEVDAPPTTRTFRKR